MMQFLKTTFKITTYTGIAAALAVAAVPPALEVMHNEAQQNRVDAALDKIVQEKFFVCDPDAAGAVKDVRDQKLRALLRDAYGDHLPRWNAIADIYLDGAKRLSNKAPSVARLAEKAGLNVPEDFHKGRFITQLDKLAAETEDHAKTGVGVCFDKNLEKQGAGSAYMRDRGLVVLNPALPNEGLTMHIRRQFQLVGQEFTEPYDRMIADGRERQVSFEERHKAMKAMVARNEGPVMALPAGEDAKASQFKEIARKDYRAPVLDEQPAPAAPTGKENGLAKTQKPAARGG